MDDELWVFELVTASDTVASGEELRVELRWVEAPDDVERERYDNGMAVSYVRLLLTGNRCYEWVDVDELRAVGSYIP